MTFYKTIQSTMLLLALAAPSLNAIQAQQDDEERKEKSGPDERNAVRMVRTLNTAELSYALTYKDQGFACQLTQLGPKVGNEASKSAAGLIDTVLATGKSKGYIFALNCADDIAPYTRVTVQAVPENRLSGARAFCSDLYVSLGKVVGGIINAAKDGKAATCLIKGAPLR